MKKLMLALVLAGTFATSHAQKNTITHEAMWLMKRVGAPEVSPDGKWVAFSVTEPAYDEKEVVTDIWLAPADGRATPRKITGNKGGEAGYRWSPDSRKIAFSSKRDADEAGQIYILNVVEGGEAQRLTNLSTGASSPQWSPNGKFIGFTSKVYPGAFTDSANKKIADERKKQKYKARVYTSYPIRRWDQWLDEKQTHLFAQHIDSANAKNIFTNATMVSKEGFNFGGNFSWSADGSQLLFIATTDFNNAIHHEVLTNIYSVAATGGEARQLSDDGFDYSNVQAGSDGKYVYALASAANNYKVYNINKLIRFDWPSMSNRIMITQNFDLPINGYELTDGNTIFLNGEEQGQDKIFSVPVSGGVPTSVIDNKRGCLTALSVSENGNVLVANYEDATMPAEVVRLNAGTKGYDFISSFNKEKLSKLDLTPLESIWTKSSRGKQIHSLLLRPAGFDANKKYPLFVLMHGGPAVAWKDNWGYRWNFQMLASPGYVVLLTNYTGSPGYGEKFAQDIQFDPFKGPASEINEAAADAVKRFSFIDGATQAAGGASYGGHLANWMQATTTHYKCLINHAGLMNSEAQWATSDVSYGREVMAGGTPWTPTKTWKEQNPVRYAAKFKTPMLVTVGELDYRVPLNNTLETWAVLQKQKVPSKLIVFPEENHWILKPENSKFFYQEVHAWLKKYLN